MTGCIATFFASLCHFAVFFTEIAIFKSLSAGGMAPVPQVAQQISQEEKQQQNGPDLSSLLNSLPAAQSRNPVLPQQAQPAGWDKEPCGPNSSSLTTGIFVYYTMFILYNVCVSFYVGSVDLGVFAWRFVGGRIPAWGERSK